MSNVVWDSSNPSNPLGVAATKDANGLGQPNVVLMGSTVPDASPVPSKIVSTTVAVPVDKQAIYRAQGFTTTTALGASASYTSPSLDGIQYRRLTGKVYADQAGTLNIQHSDDGTTWDTLTSISVTAATPAKFDEPIYARYIRVLYTNGTTAQTVFRLSGYPSVE